jgi:glutathione S-transferase
MEHAVSLPRAPAAALYADGERAMRRGLELVSHALCPYVQRAAIALAEKGVPFTRTVVDLDAKPAWFAAISPLGKVPLVRVGEAVLFESAAILEYLEDTEPGPLHPRDAVQRARHRAWIEFGSVLLNDVGSFYTAPDDAALQARAAALRAKFQRVEAELGEGPYFAGTAFSLVDAAFGPLFRYFDAFDRIADFGILAGLPKVAAWRHALGERASVRDAVGADYPKRLRRFLQERRSHLSSLMRDD